jgi:hypothetical protein
VRAVAQFQQAIGGKFQHGVAGGRLSVEWGSVQTGAV